MSKRKDPMMGEFNGMDRTELRRAIISMSNDLQEEKAAKLLLEEKIESLSNMAGDICQLQKSNILKELIPNPTAIAVYGNKSRIESLVLAAKVPTLEDL